MITSPEELKMLSESQIVKKNPEKDEEKLNLRERITQKWAGILGGKNDDVEKKDGKKPN